MTAVAWWLAAEDAAGLAAKLDALVDGSPPVTHIANPPGDAVGWARLGIVDPDERKVRLARRLLTEGTPWRSGRSDLWFAPTGLADEDGASRGRVAFLFPGVEPAFAGDGIELAALARPFGLEAPLLEDDTIAHRSASIVRLGIFLDRVVRRLGVEPDLVAGHSIGEWAGSVASGILTRHGAEQLLGSVDPHTVELPDLDFAALSAGIVAVDQVVRDIPGIHISHDNCPSQSVICGPPAIVDQALVALRGANIFGQRLAFQSGFHTPWMEATLGVFRDYLEGLTITPARTPLWSATSLAPYPDQPADIIDLHLRHLVEPVRFGPLIERLYHDAGARVFVQLGIGTLTSFIDDTLGDFPHACVPVVTAKRPALAQIHRALTALWVEGLDVSLTELEPVPAAAAPVPARSTSGTGTALALLAATEMLTAAAQASHGVVGALLSRLSSPERGAARPAPRPPRPPASAPAPAPAPAPEPVPEPQPAWPTEKVVVTRRLSLETMPETIDHSLFHQPAGWPDVTDGFPIVAMTTQIQLLQDVVAPYTGGRDVVEVFGVRNLRWLDLSEPQDVDVTIVPKDDDVLAVALGGYCRANLRVGDHPAAPAYEPSPLRNPHPTQHTGPGMFDQRVMFHGPRFQGINTLGPTGDDGIVGEFHNLDTPGSLLDNFGKIVAYWVIDQRDLGESPLPIGVDRIELFGPTPPAGIDLHCEVRIVELQAHLVRADGVIVRPDGRPWCRVSGWTSNVFHIDPVMEPIYHEPGVNYAAEPQPGGWNVVIERWPTGAGRDLTARRFLCRAERAHYETLNLLEQRRWLIDTIAAKDSVRRWLGERYGIPAFPVEVTLEPDGDRRFRAVSRLIPAGHDLRITVSSLDWLAVAIVGDGAYHDIEARIVAESAGADQIAVEAAAAVRARNPGALVASVAAVDDIIPSSIDVVVIPHLAVAWTEEPSG